MQLWKDNIGLILAISVVTTVLVFFASSKTQSNSVAAESNGHTIFSSNCAGCHSGGSNLMNPSKPVTRSKKLASKATFQEFLLKPTGGMPSFSSIAQKDADLSALYAYCKALK